MPEIEEDLQPNLSPVYDPKEPPEYPFGYQTIKARIIPEMNFPSPAHKFLYDHRKEQMSAKDPYVVSDDKGELQIRTGLQLMFPGVADKIRKTKEAGVKNEVKISDDRIMATIIDKVEQSLEAGVSEDELANYLFEDKDYSWIKNLTAGFGLAKERARKQILPYFNSSWHHYAATHYSDLERPLTKLREKKGEPLNKEDLIQAAKDGEISGYYAEQHTRIFNDVVAIPGAFLKGMLPVGNKTYDAWAKQFGLDRFPTPETSAGTIVGATAQLAGFITGIPGKVGVAVSGLYAPTAKTSLAFMAQRMWQGGASLSNMFMVSDALNAYQESDTLLEAYQRVGESGRMGLMIGSLYPISGFTESKLLKTAVGLAVMDKIRAGTGEWFTIDDVYAGIKDGTIDKQELYHRVFGYLLDIYFINKVPTIKKQVMEMKKTVLVDEILKANPLEAERLLIEMAEVGLVPPAWKEHLKKFSPKDIKDAYGNVEQFRSLFYSLKPEMVNLANEIIQEAKALRFQTPTELKKLTWNQLQRQATTLGVKQKTTTPVKLSPSKQAAADAKRRIAEAKARIEGKILPAEKPRALTRPELETEVYNALKKVKGKTVEEKISFLPPKRLQYFKDQLKSMTDIEDMFRQGDVAFNSLYKLPIKEAYAKLQTLAWDAQAPVKAKLLKQFGSLGEAAVHNMELRKGASAHASLLTNELIKEVYSTGHKNWFNLSHKDRKMLDEIISLRGQIIGASRRKKSILHPLGVKAQQAQTYLERLRKNDPKLFDNLNKRADAYFRKTKELLDWAYKNGVIEKKIYDKITKPPYEYELRQFIQFIDPERGPIYSGIRPLKKGSTKHLETNSLALFSEMANRLTARVMKNKANQELWGLVQDNPTNTLVREAPRSGVTETGKVLYKKELPQGMSRIGVYVKGKYRQMMMIDKLADQWNTSNVQPMDKMTSEVLQWMTGNRVLKALATGYNPEFALTNFPRDLQHMWMVSTEWSMHSPVAVAQMAKDLAATAKDAWTRTGSYVDYIKEGGGMAFLTHQGRISGKQFYTGKLGQLQKFAGYLGETSEIWSRLALRNRAIRNGKSPVEATHTARTYLDFAQGGTVTKVAENFIPYFNAGVQVTRGLGRGAKEHPAVFSYKMAQMFTLASGLYLANKNVNPEAWESISKYDKEKFFIITTPWTYTDDQGQKRHTYVKIAKDSGQEIVGALARNLMARHMGYDEDVNIDEAMLAAASIFQWSPSQMPPVMEAGLTYMMNTDFWTREDVWRGPDLPGNEQDEYYPSTHPAYVKWGEVTGMSPVRTEAAVKQLFPRNIYTDAVGAGLRGMMEKLPEDIREKVIEEQILNWPGFRRLFDTTYPFTKYEEDVETITSDESAKRVRQNRRLDALSEQYYTEKGGIGKAEILSFIKEQPPEDKSRLRTRFKSESKLYEDGKPIDEVSWWKTLLHSSPETRAHIFWLKWKGSSSEKRKEIESRANKVLPGTKESKERFRHEFRELKKRDEAEYKFESSTVNFESQVDANDFSVIDVDDLNVDVNDFNDLLDAIGEVESGNDPNAVGDGGKAVGTHQIWPITVRDANRILDPNKYKKKPYHTYTLEDRKDPVKSREMTMIVLAHYEDTIEAMAKRWNGGTGWSKKPKVKEYWEKIKKVLGVKSE